MHKEVLWYQGLACILLLGTKYYSNLNSVLTNIFPHYIPYKAMGIKESINQTEPAIVSIDLKEC